MTPQQLGIPYSRPRYFALAKRGGAFALPTPPEAAGPLRQPPSVLLTQQQQQEAAGSTAEGGSSTPGSSSQAASQPAVAARPLREFLVADPSSELEGGVLAKLPPGFLERQRTAGTAGSAEVAAAGPAAVSCGMDAAPARDAAQQQQDTVAAAASGAQQAQEPERAEAGAGGAWAAFRVPLAVIERHGWCFDLVSPDSTTSNCFTKTYSQYVKVRRRLLAWICACACVCMCMCIPASVVWWGCLRYLAAMRLHCG